MFLLNNIESNATVDYYIKVKQSSNKLEQSLCKNWQLRLTVCYDGQLPCEATDILATLIVSKCNPGTLYSFPIRYLALVDKSNKVKEKEKQVL